MKARHKKTRWSLISLLFGLLAATGLMTGMILTHHRGVAFVTTATQPVSPGHAVMQRLHAALVAATEGKQTLTHDVVAPLAHELAHATSSNDPQSYPGGHTGASSNNATAMAGAQPQSVPVGGTGDGTQQSNPRASSGAGPTTPQEGQYAYNGFIPLDCGLPAGCGVVNTGYVTHPPSSGVDTAPIARNSQGSNPPDDGPNDPGQGSNPQDPGPNPSVTAAPELDPGTLAGAITLLLGSLAVLRGRRVRLSRAAPGRVTR